MALALGLFFYSNDAGELRVISLREKTKVQKRRGADLTTLAHHVEDASAGT